MSNLISIIVNKETIESGNAELLMCEARDCLKKDNFKPVQWVTTTT